MPSRLLSVRPTMPTKRDAQEYLLQYRSFISKYGFKPAETVGNPGHSLARAVRLAKNRGVFNTAQLKEMESMLTNPPTGLGAAAAVAATAAAWGAAAAVVPQASVVAAGSLSALEQSANATPGAVAPPRTSTMAPADPPPGADGKRRRLQSKTCSTLAPYHAPLSTSLPSARLPCTSQGTAPAAAPIESEPERLALRGLNIQWPFSQLILAGIKTAEVRGYTLGHRNPNVLPGEEVWLIETKGTSEAPGNAVGDRACFGERPQKARIVGTVTFSHAERYADVTAFRADVSNHCICEGGDKDWDGSGERYAWRIASVSALQEPLVDPVKTQTGIPAPCDVRGGVFGEG